MVNFGPLTAEIGSTIWGTPTNFNWFLVLAPSVQRRNLADVGAGLYMYVVVVKSSRSPDEFLCFCGVTKELLVFDEVLHHECGHFGVEARGEVCVTVVLCVGCSVESPLSPTHDSPFLNEW